MTDNYYYDGNDNSNDSRSSKYRFSLWCRFAPVFAPVEDLY